MLTKRQQQVLTFLEDAVQRHGVMPSTREIQERLVAPWHGRIKEATGATTREVETLRARLASSDGLTSEVSTLKEERDVIRTRVTEMLEQLEALNL